MTALSILVVHHENADGLARTLRAIDRQTFTGTQEVLVGDDASSPAIFGQVEQIAATVRGPVRILRNSAVRGRSYTRNVLLDAAAGKYLTWCDAGDEYQPNKIEQQVQGLFRARFLGQFEPMWCTCNAELVDGDALTAVVQDIEGGHVDRLLRATLRPYLSTMLGTTRSFRDVGYFDLELPCLEDLDFCLRYALQDGHFVLPPKADSLCTHQESALEHDPGMLERSLRAIHRKQTAALLKRSRRYRRNRTFQAYQRLAEMTAERGDTARAAVYYGASALRHPIGFARWLLQNRGRP